MASNKTLILMDTNKTRNVLSGSPRYDTFDFGKEFTELKTFLDDKGIAEHITFAITEMTLKELLKQKKIVYDHDIKSLHETLARLKNLENANIPELTLPPNDFDCIAYLMPKVNTFLQENNIFLIKIADEHKASVFDKLIDNVIKILPPFRKGKDNSCSGHGFKDAIIWETLKHSNLINDYNNIILYSKDEDFNGCEKDIEHKNFKIIKEYVELDSEIKKLYQSNIKEKEIESIIDKEYFRNLLLQKIAEQVGVDSASIEILTLASNTIDNIHELQSLFTDFGEQYDILVFDDTFGIVSRVKINNIEYSVYSLVDLVTKEIGMIQVVPILDLE